VSEQTEYLDDYFFEAVADFVLLPTARRKKERERRVVERRELLEDEVNKVLIFDAKWDYRHLAHPESCTEWDCCWRPILFTLIRVSSKVCLYVSSFKTAIMKRKC
jgi:hypothetical protein